MNKQKIDIKELIKFVGISMGIFILVSFLFFLLATAFNTWNHTTFHNINTLNGKTNGKLKYVLVGLVTIIGVLINYVFSNKLHNKKSIILIDSIVLLNLSVYSGANIISQGSTKGSVEIKNYDYILIIYGIMTIYFVILQITNKVFEVWQKSKKPKKKENVISKKHKTDKLKLWFALILVVVILFLIFSLWQKPWCWNLLGAQNGRSDVYWNNTWNFIFATTATIIAVYNIRLEIKKERDAKTEKAAKEAADKYNEEVGNFLSNSLQSLEICKFNIDNPEHMKKSEFKRQILRILGQLFSFNRATLSGQFIYNVMDPLHLPYPTMSEIFKSQTGKSIFDELIKEYPFYEGILNELMQKNGVYGDWLINKDYAQKVDYIIGIDQAKHEFVKAVQLNPNKKIIDLHLDLPRIRFNDSGTKKLNVDSNNLASLNSILNNVSQYKSMLGSPVYYFNLEFNKFNNSKFNNIYELLGVTENTKKSIEDKQYNILVVPLVTNAPKEQ